MKDGHEDSRRCRTSRVVSDRRPRCVWRNGYDRIARDLSTRKAVADDAGNLHVPDTYRTTYELLGSWAVAADQGQGSKQLHVVYASPGTIAAYRMDGRFPDGAVLVKEVFKAATGQMTTGTVSHAETLKGWFVMMKDSKGRHAGNKVWG